MKFLRYGEKGTERPGLLDDSGMIRDLSGVIDDVAGAAILPESLEKLRAIDPSSLPALEGSPRLGPCVTGVGRFLCIGLNYSEHVEESGQEVPAEPVLFTKFTSALAGPDDDIIIPYDFSKTDWEIELGFVIGLPAKHVSVRMSRRSRL